jgi:hypothetical protein
VRERDRQRERERGRRRGKGGPDIPAENFNCGIGTITAWRVDEGGADRLWFLF